MALTSSGLTSGGITSHYRFQYDDSLSAPVNPGGPEPARTNAVIAACENDFNLMSGWFGNIALDVNFTIPVNVSQNGGGASWRLGGGNLTVTINPSNGAASLVRYLLVSEMVEQFMRAQGRGWYGSGTEGSEGEGLSRFLAAQFLIINGFDTFGNAPAGFGNSNAWLNSARTDYVNNISLSDDGPDAITGCSLLFIWYLFTQLGYSVNAIVAAAAPTLGGVYRNLTGDNSDPFPAFKQLLDTGFPGTSTITAGTTSGNLDSPFPLGSRVSGPAVAWSSDRLDAFGIGTDNALYHMAWDGANWSGWENRGGTLMGTPSVVSWGPNRLDVFGIGTDNALYHMAWDGSNWSGWEGRGGTLVHPVDAVCWGQNRIDVFGIGTDNAMYHMAWDGASWSGWENRGGTLLGTPKVVAWGLNRLDVFGIGTDNAMYHMAWDGSNWSGWENRGGTLIGNPNVVSWRPNRLDAFGIGTDNALYHMAWDGSNWSGWENRGGTLVGFS